MCVGCGMISMIALIIAFIALGVSIFNFILLYDYSGGDKR
jgi:hypothetical protein